MQQIILSRHQAQTITDKAYFTSTLIDPKVVALVPLVQNLSVSPKSDCLFEITAYSFLPKNSPEKYVG